MTFDEFQKFIDKQDVFFRSLKKSTTERERILARTVKLSEELGELCDEVLASLKIQRKSKLANKDIHSIEDEFADVVIVAFLLAKSLHIDAAASLGRKIQKIQEKYNNELRADGGLDQGAL